MTDALKPLLENELLTDEAKQQIVEAWEGKLKEAREEIETQVREDFTSRYEHDKGVLVEAVERMVEDGIKAEIAEFIADSKTLTEQQVKLAEEIRKARVDAKTKLAEQMSLLETFVLTQLKNELSELEEDRRDIREGKKTLAKEIRENRTTYEKKITESVGKMGEFVVQHLAEEIQDFHQDKAALQTQRVKLITEGRNKIQETRKQIIKRSAHLIENKVAELLNNEMSQFREDIVASRQKKFGMDMFEAFAAEYKTTFFNENSEVKTLKSKIAENEEKLAEAAKLFEQAGDMVKTSQKKQQLAENKANRITIMNELLGKLSGSHKDVMADLLEGVKTNKLHEQFKKYIPAVTSGSGSTALNRKVTVAKPLQESKTKFTGNKRNKLNESVESSDAGQTAEIIEMKRLAGIK
jgi:hypothetical protein